MQKWAVTAGRVLLGVYFLVPGLSKIPGYAGTLDYMLLHQIPLADILLPLTILLQVGGGLFLIAGYRLAQTALMLAGLTLLINLGMHDFWNTYEGTDPGHELQNFIKNLAIMAGLLVLSGSQQVEQFKLVSSKD